MRNQKIIADIVGPLGKVRTLALENVHGFVNLLRSFYEIGGAAVVLSTLIVSLLTLKLSDHIHPDYRFDAASVIIHWILTCCICIMYPIIPLTGSAIDTPLIFGITIAIPIMIIWCLGRTWCLTNNLRWRINCHENDEKRLNERIKKLEDELKEKEEEIEDLQELLEDSEEQEE